jgi:hypothetical protein
MLDKTLVLFYYLVTSKDVEIHKVIEEVSMKGLIEIEQYSNPWLTLTFRHDNIKLVF